ncbi:MAG: tyrosine-type recombinase/integrase [Spirochaetota bacterium]
MSGFHSPLAPYITGLSEQKRACGYAYVHQEYVLESFDRFCIGQGHEVNTITRDLVMKWAIQRSTEGKNQRNQRVSFVRQLAQYMLSLGIDVYVPQHYASETVRAPHILSMRELVEFYAAVDSYEPPHPSLRRLGPTYRILFRLYYCCGLRLVEACRLRRSCVDLVEGSIRILHSKGDKDRLVPLAADVQSACADYDAMMHRIVPDREWFFPGMKLDRPFEKTSLDRKFRQLWARTPSAASVDRRPTIHCLRHTFVVNKVNEWMDAGLDLGAMLPYLSRYLGHASISETQHYYHAIAQAFPAVRRYDSVSAYIIPEVDSHEE